MVITVQCPSCASSFPVDSNKVPEGGVNARCSSCGQIFRVEKEPAEVDAPAPPEPVATEASPAPEAPVAPATPEPAPPLAEPPPPPEPVVAETPRESAPAGATVQGFTFGKRDPTDKARRLARVLVSDMIMYNAERHQDALATGTLVQDFEEEIEKSWKEFVEQVGQELADGAGKGFWREALNDILAKGEELF